MGNRLRHLLAHPRLRRVTRSRIVREKLARLAAMRLLFRVRVLAEPARFVWRLILREGDPAPYTIRGRQRQVMLASRWADLETVDEVYRQRVYDPPP